MHNVYLSHGLLFTWTQQTCNFYLFITVENNLLNIHERKKRLTWVIKACMDTNACLVSSPIPYQLWTAPYYSSPPLAHQNCSFPLLTSPYIGPIPHMSTLVSYKMTVNTVHMVSRMLHQGQTFCHNGTCWVSQNISLSKNCNRK
jgi:hypothetical protein